MKKTKILSSVIIILIIVLAIVLYWQLGTENKYYAVYLSTGDIYFGSLQKFPKLVLKDVWYLQRGADGEEASLQLNEFKKAIWEPEGKVYLNSENVVWFAPLGGKSQIAEVIKNPQSFQAVPSSGGGLNALPQSDTLSPSISE